MTDQPCPRCAEIEAQLTAMTAERDSALDRFAKATEELLAVKIERDKWRNAIECIRAIILQEIGPLGINYALGIIDDNTPDSAAGVIGGSE